MSKGERLDSISRPLGGPSTPAPSSAKPSLRFKPKAVARRTKEERDADAPILVPGTNHRPQQSTRGRGRGGRSARGRMMAGTTLVTAGPLASGAVSLGGTVGSTAMRSSTSPTPEFLKDLRDKMIKKNSSERKVPSATNAEASDEEDFIADDLSARINMSKSHEWNSEELELFPVRAEREQHHDYGEEPLPDKAVKTEFHRDFSMPPPTDSEPTTRESSVKPEAEETRIPGPETEQEEINTEPKALNEYQDEQERIRLEEDYESILDFIKKYDINKAESRESSVEMTESMDVDETTDASIKPEPKKKAENDTFLFVQLPEKLPSFDLPKKTTNKVKKEVKDEPVGTQLSKNDNSLRGNSGIVGKLRVHKSGKVTMKIGNVILDVTRGGAANLVQDLVAVNNIDKECHYLGRVGEKIIATPKFT